MNINLEVNEIQGVAASLVALAQVADAADQPEVAVQLLGKADAVVGPSGPQLLPFDRGQHELIIARLRSRVDPPTWEQAWGIGRQLSLDEAVSLAESLAAPSPTELTDRQCAILRRLALGETNREIAEGLGLSLATVERHVANIYVRIGARGRAAATLYAVRSGLVPSSSA
jgi:DNA-binding CsgD family transcriptional regulator